MKYSSSRNRAESMSGICRSRWMRSLRVVMLAAAGILALMVCAQASDVGQIEEGDELQLAFNQQIHSKSAESQPLIEESTFTIDFPINDDRVLPGFRSNRQTLDSLRCLLARVEFEPRLELQRVDVCGTASPDGRVDSNLALANRRMHSLARYLNEQMNIADSLIDMRESYIPWDEFRSMAAAGEIPMAEQVLKISSVGSDASQADVALRMKKLRSLGKGSVWRVLSRDVFPRLRRAVVVSITLRQPEPDHEPLPAPDFSDFAVMEEEQPVDTIPSAAPACEFPAPCRRSWHISTNALALALAIPNAAGEYDFACRWSAVLSVYYSAWNYGTRTRKFRTFIFRPEMRFWLRQGGNAHSGLFFDAHLQMASFNFALPGWDYRIQDTDGKRPALGGGLGIGWRQQLGRSRWALEAQVGAGFYHLKYDRFENRGNGPHVDTRSRNWFGIDNAAISIVYHFKPFKR